MRRFAPLLLIPALLLTGCSTLTNAVEKGGVAINNAQDVAASANALIQQQQNTVNDPSGDGPTQIQTADMAVVTSTILTQQMTVAQAQSLITSKGYTARITSINGQAQPATMDHNPFRFNLAITGEPGQEIVTGIQMG